MKKKKLPQAMGTILRYKLADELKHWRHCDRCGKRFSEQYMVWVDSMGWSCADCERKIW